MYIKSVATTDFGSTTLITDRIFWFCYLISTISVLEKVTLPFIDFEICVTVKYGNFQYLEGWSRPTVDVRTKQFACSYITFVRSTGCFTNKVQSDFVADTQCVKVWISQMLSRKYVLQWQRGFSVLPVASIQ